VKSSIFHIAFIGANGIHPFTGFTCNDEMESNMKKAVIKQAINYYICMDSSKINKLNNVKVADAADTVWITDALTEDFDYSIFKQVVSCTKNGVRFVKKERQ
jgi:DeoR family fructose operon transcriptional repressor